MKKGIAVVVCVALMAPFVLCACSSSDSSFSAELSPNVQREAVVGLDGEGEIEIGEDQLVMKASSGEDFAVPLDEVTVTVYDASKDGAAVEYAMERLKMMGIRHIKTKKPTGVDSSIVVFREPGYEEIARLIAEDLHINLVHETANDGTSGWSFDSNIAVVIAGS